MGTSGERWTAEAAEAPLPPPAAAAAVAAAATVAAAIEPEGVTVLPPGQRYLQAAGPVTRGEAQRQSNPPRLAIGSGNVGYRLLQKAGWSEGRGIGAQEQGEQEPVEAEMNKGSAGLGFARKKAPSGPKPLPSEKRQRGELQAAAAGRALPPDELADEPLDVRVKRYRQVMQAEADEKAGRQIERYVRSAFNDATGEPTSDSNPLLRRNKRLTATNPLL